MSNFHLLPGNISASEITEPLQLGGLVGHEMASQFLAWTVASGNFGLSLWLSPLKRLFLCLVQPMFI